MSQSNLKTLFTRKNHREFYFAISSDNSFFATVEKIVVVIKKSKNLELVTTNAFEITKTSHVVLIARDETILIKIQIVLKSVCICTQFSYWVSDITNAKNMIKMFDFVRKYLRESNILILCASYLHTLKMRLDILEEELNRSFDLNFQINVNLVRKFFNSMRKNMKTKIIINMSITTIHTR
jgi:short-subunit dehydrogenase